MASAGQKLKSGELARQWLALAERRRDHLLELYNSGRWRRYYREDELMAQMRAVGRDIDAWREAADDPSAWRRTAAIPQAAPPA